MRKAFRLRRQRKERPEVAGDKDDIDVIALGALEIAAARAVFGLERADARRRRGALSRGGSRR
jgi:hypothetical protein